MEIDHLADEAPSPLEVSSEQGTAGQTKGARKRRVITFLVVSLSCVAVLALLGSQLLVPAQGQSHLGSAQGSSSPLDGHPAPNFTLAVLSTQPGLSIHLASFKGKAVMLNFWASWCDPCKHEAPLLQATWQHVKGQGIVFLGIDFEDSNVVDASGSVAINYGVTGVPETVFIDRHGVIVRKVIGELTEQTLDSNLQLLSR